MSETRETLYERGYNDGLNGRPPADAGLDDYWAGYQDGMGDRTINEEVQVRPVDDDWYAVNSPPTDFDWAGEKRTPGAGDFYLSKNGNPNFAWRERKNAQKRHILVVKGHEGHKIQPETDKKTKWLHCKTCKNFVPLTVHRI